MREPAVIGAVIELGNCLDLVQSKYLKEIKKSYIQLCEYTTAYGLQLPVNKLADSGDLLVRHLDCAVIEMNHLINTSENQYDTVRGVFFEGNDLYENAGFKEKNHIQIAVRNLNCIKGFFIPRRELA